MAILKKRRSQASLPEVTSDRGVIVSRPGDKLTSRITGSPDVGRPNTRPGDRPEGTVSGGDLGGTRPQLTSRTSKPITSAGGTPASRLTSAIKGEAVSTPKIGGGSTVTPAKGVAKTTGSAKPAISTAAGAPKTITSKVTGATRPTVSTTQGKTGNSSGLTNAITGALTGAAIGAGTKMVYDKLTGTKKVVDANKVTGGTGSKTTTGTGSSGTGLKPGAGGTGLKPGTGSGTGLKVPGVGTPPFVPTGSTKPGGTTTKPGGTTTKPGGTTTKPGGTTTKPGGPTKPTTGGPKAPVTPKSPTKPGGSTTKPGGGTGGTKTGTGASGFPVGVSPNATANEDGTYTETFDDGSTITYGADGEIMSTTDAEGTETVGNEDGTTTYTYDDGSTVTVDANGNVISSTEAEDEFAADSTGTEVDEEGNTVYTYDDGSTVTIDEDGNVISSTDATDMDEEGSETTTTGGTRGLFGNNAGNEEVLDEGATDEELEELGYYEDEYGNIYDNSGELVYSADDYYTDDEIADYIYTDEYGNEYDYYGNLVSESDHSDYLYTDDDGYQYDWDGNVVFDPYAGEDEYTWEEEITYPEEEEEYAEDEYDYGDPDYWGKKGGLVALMNNGGKVRAFQEGGDEGEEVYYDEDVPEDYPLTYYNPDGSEVRYFGGAEPRATSTYFGAGSPDTSLLQNTYEGSDDVEYFDDGSYIVYYEDGSSVTYDSDGAVYQYTANGVENSMAEQQMDKDTSDTSTAGGSEDSRYSVGNIQYFDDGSYIQTFDDGSTMTVDSEGNVYGSTDAPDYSVTGAGSGSGRTDYYKTQTAAERARAAAEQKQLETQSKSAVSDILDKITGSGYLGAGAAGAVLGALLGNTDLFSGGSGTQNQGIDMSKVGVINPRTTDFGVGPANYVGYDQYAAREEMPEIYGDELYRNLNAPGFNPVNEGDYGYEDVEATEQTEDEEEAPKMADGGLAGGYYTFGKAVDPISNLTNPRPAQQTQAPQMAQMGGLPRAGGLPNSPAMGTPQQPSAQQQMPQQVQMPPAMKRGGLPALSNVPMAEGRLDFRKGSAVHGPGDGQSDDIPAMLADGEYVIDAETVAQIGNGSTKAGAKALDEFRQNIRKHKRSAPLDKIPPKTKTLTSYLKKGK